jgi:hypothetical protein
VKQITRSPHPSVRSNFHIYWPSFRTFARHSFDNAQTSQIACCEVYFGPSMMDSMLGKERYVRNRHLANIVDMGSSQ